jgi:hypothetical protein
MSKFETRFEVDADAEQIWSAFYGLVARHADDETVDGDAHISSEIDCTGRRLCVRLWSAEVMDQFLSILAGTVAPAKRPCFE